MKDYTFKVNENGDIEISFITKITISMNKFDRYLEHMEEHIDVAT